MNHELESNPQISANRLLTGHFRCPEGLVDLAVTDDLPPGSGYFRFGFGGICYGQCSSGTPAAAVTDELHDASDYVSVNGSSVQLSFDPVQVLENHDYPTVAEIFRRVNSQGKILVTAELDLQR